MHFWRSALTSSSVSVRSSARNRSANARLTLPGPSASDRKTSNSATFSSSSPPPARPASPAPPRRERCRRRRRRGRRSTPGSARPGSTCDPSACRRAARRRRSRTRRPGRPATARRRPPRRLHRSPRPRRRRPVSGAAGGMEARDCGRVEPEVGDAELLRERIQHGGRVVDVDRAVGFVRRAPGVMSARERERAALLRQRLAVAGRRERRSALEQRDVGLAVRGVVRDRAQQPGQRVPAAGSTPRPAAGSRPR